MGVSVTSYTIFGIRLPLDKMRASKYYENEEFGEPSFAECLVIFDEYMANMNTCILAVKHIAHDSVHSPQIQGFTLPEINRFAEQVYNDLDDKVTECFGEIEEDNFGIFHIVTYT